MKRVLVLFGMLAVELLLLLWSRSEPSYGGQRISAWITQLDDTGASRRQEAQTALQRLGSKGRAWMVRRLNREELRADKKHDRDRALVTFRLHHACPGHQHGRCRESLWP